MRLHIIDSPKFALTRTWLTAYASRLWQRAGVVVALAALILFGDTLLPLFGHVLHVLNEVIGVGIRTFP